LGGVQFVSRTWGEAWRSPAKRGEAKIRGYKGFLQAPRRTAQRHEELNCPGEAIEVLFLLPCELDRDEDADMKSARFLVDGGNVARDYAALLEKLHPAVAGRDRKPDPVRKLLHGYAAVRLQQRKDFPVDGVERRHWDKPWDVGLVLGNYT